MEYKIKKEEFKKEDIEFMNVLFDNGDSLPILGAEIVDISLKLYDKLILVENTYCQQFCPMIESGCIKLKLAKKHKKFYIDAYLYNLKEYNKDRVSYIKNRFCNENDIKRVQLLNGNNHCRTLCGNVTAKLDGDFVILVFNPKRIEQPFNNEYNTILLPEVDKMAIQKIDLDFENCDGVGIYNEEIVEMQLKFKAELSAEGGDYNRQLDSGYIKLKLNSKINSYRNNAFYDELRKGKKGNKQIERRLCGCKGFDLHDICHLYINYECAGFGQRNRECIGIEDIRSIEELDEIEKFNNKEEYDFMPYYLGGYFQKLEDESILIVFGKAAQKNEKCRQMLKEYSIFNHNRA